MSTREKPAPTLWSWKRISVLAVGLMCSGCAVWFRFMDVHVLAYFVFAIVGLLGVILAISGPESDVATSVRGVGKALASILDAML